jgi:rhodanese-related sulfurtransferase
LPTRRNFLLLTAAIAAGAAVGYPLINPAYGGTTLDARTAHRRTEAKEITLIDIRRPDEWQATGTAKGAHRLDLRNPGFIDALSAIVAGDRTRPIALICARGVRSARIANLLTENGFASIIDVPEGMLGSSAGPGWIARGLPLTTS